MTILTPNSSDILQTNDHANMEERYRKAGVVANDGETNSGVTLESAPPGASPGGWCGVGGGYSYPPPAATPLASASSSHCHGFIDLFTPTADWRWLLLLCQTSAEDSTTDHLVSAPHSTDQCSGQARDGRHGGHHQGSADRAAAAQGAGGYGEVSGLYSVPTPGWVSRLCRAGTLMTSS